MDTYQQFIHVSKYARWLDDEKRRETWLETVGRYIDFFDRLTNMEHSTLLQGKIKKAILNMEVMPSMRAMMTAGQALERENIAGYNCAFLAVNSKRSFAEALYILMCGTGVGYSVEHIHVSKLPPIPDTIEKSDSVIVVADSKKGWAKAYHGLLHALWNGDEPTIDYSRIRPAGARLKTFGGRASGPEPLRGLFNQTIETFKRNTGRKLSTLDCHDIMCRIADIVVVGGVRRAAMISLSDLSDHDIRICKSGDWRKMNKQRDLANNSAVYDEKPSIEQFLEEWKALIESKSGERGIFNRKTARKQAARWGRRSYDALYGVNPCCEIILLIMQFCNLSEVIIREHDTVATLKRKVEIATILGTFQSLLVNFGFISESWKRNTEEERLLGVSLTGIMDNSITNGTEGHEKLKKVLESLRDHARKVNAEWAKLLGIPESAAITCVKPSGTVSQLCNTASGIHTRHSKQYIRTARIDKKDPLYSFMVEKGFAIEDCVIRPDSTAVVSFPIKAPAGAKTRDDLSAIESLELWKIYQEHWCEHKPSVTINVKDHEWLEVGAWVYKNFDDISGISFLPFDGGEYQQAPYQAMSDEDFAKWVENNPQPIVNWSELNETDDNTTSMQTLACTGGSCEI